MRDAAVLGTGRPRVTSPPSAAVRPPATACTGLSAWLDGLDYVPLPALGLPLG